MATGQIFSFRHRRPKLKIGDKRQERAFIVSASKVVLCYNGLNYKGLYEKTTDLFYIVEIILVWQ